MNTTELIESIDNQIVNIRTKSLDVSFNEIYDMFESGELIISPDYQRLFRWDEEKQSRFIESLILEMPVPPIFVIEISDGTYELIDGLQRISSYIHFRGKEFSLESGTFTEKSNNFTLSGCDIIPQINGYNYDSLPKSLQIKLKRNFVRMEVIKKESEPTLKYHMFKRLNTGGELLSPQEVRNCTIRLLGASGIEFLNSCSKNEYFKNSIKRIGEDKFKTLYDQELVLRFFALKNNLESYKNPLTEYLTIYLEKITTDKINFNFETEKEIFNSTFQFISDTLDEEAFSSITKNGTIKNDFVGYLFDAFTIAIAQHITQLINYPNKENIKKCLLDCKKNSELQPYTTGSQFNIKERIKIVSGKISDVLNAKQ